jgi:hypothetical protein
MNQLISEKDKNLLNKYGWNFAHFNSLDDFSIYNQDGSNIQSCSEALSYLIEDLNLREEEEVPKLKSMTEKEILESFGYDFLSESPIEIIKKDDNKVLITGEAALIFIANLKSIIFLQNV